MAAGPGVRRPLPHLARCTGAPWALASDPWVSIGAGGAVYVSSLIITPGRPVRSALAVSVSTDGGSRWQEATAQRLRQTQEVVAKCGIHVTAGAWRSFAANWSGTAK